VNCNFLTALFQNSELALVHCECYIGKQTVIARNKKLIVIELLVLRLLEIFAS